MRPLMPIDDRVAALEAIARTRPLSKAEADDLDRLLSLLHQRRMRLPDQLERARARVEALVERLSPADRLRELRAEAKRAADLVRTFEAELR